MVHFFPRRNPRLVRCGVSDGAALTIGEKFRSTMEDEDGIAILPPCINLEKIPPLNQRREVAFVNYFVTSTVSFLNKFAASCEEKLSEVDMRIQKAEVLLALLEVKLASIPGLKEAALSTEPPPGSSALAPPQEPKQLSEVMKTQEGPETTTLVQAIPLETSPAQASAASSLEAATITKVSQDPRYAKYFKMLKVGVPAASFSMKMVAEGLDPTLLNTPDAPAPPGAPTPESDSNNSSGSESDAG